MTGDARTHTCWHRWAGPGGVESRLRDPLPNVLANLGHDPGRRRLAGCTTASARGASSPRLEAPRSRTPQRPSLCDRADRPGRRRITCATPTDLSRSRTRGASRHAAGRSRVAFVRAGPGLPVLPDALGPEARGQGWAPDDAEREASAQHHRVPLTASGPGVGSDAGSIGCPAPVTHRNPRRTRIARRFRAHRVPAQSVRCRCRVPGRLPR